MNDLTKFLWKQLLLVFLVVGFSGCSMWTQMKESDYTDKKYKFTASVPIDWMRYNMGDHFLITRDGAALNTIQVYRQKLKKELPNTKKKFQADMLPQDLAELEFDELKSDEAKASVQKINDIPMTIADHEGFRLEYDYTLKGGLKKKGVRIGFIAGEHIYRVIYEAPAQHYYQDAKDDFDSFVKTFDII